MTGDQYQEMRRMEAPYSTQVRIGNEVTPGVDLLRMSSEMPAELLMRYFTLCGFHRIAIRGRQVVR